MYHCYQGIDSSLTTHDYITFWQDDTLCRETYPVYVGYRMEDLIPVVLRKAGACLKAVWKALTKQMII